MILFVKQSCSLFLKQILIEYYHILGPVLGIGKGTNDVFESSYFYGVLFWRRQTNKWTLLIHCDKSYERVCSVHYEGM